MKILSKAALLTVAAVGCSAQETPSSECRVQAWVRAEDLAPDTISHGDFRIKITPAHCANQIASVALRLQLDEFGEVKHLRRGAPDFPEIKPAENRTKPDFHLDPWMQDVEGEIIYDYAAYDAAMRDPAFWVIKAEERTAWTTEATLFENNPDFSVPRVKPFIVVSPAVNYPPSVSKRRSWNNRPIMQHAFTTLWYNYVAVVNFTDGSSINLPAGHTNFIATYPPPPVRTEPFRANATFTFTSGNANNECLPEAQRLVFVAEVTLDEGNTVQTGETLKGKVTIHATNGSTTMSTFSITPETVTDHHWAAAQAAAHNDEQFCATCHGSWDRVITGAHGLANPAAESVETWLTPDKPYFDFAVKIPEDFVPGFSSYYSTSEAVLSLKLDVLFSREAAECIHGTFDDPLVFEEAGSPEEIFARQEEALWSRYMPVGVPSTPLKPWRRILHLTATVPIVVLGVTSNSLHPPEHYLNPGAPSPIMLASLGEVTHTVPLHPAQPVIVEEAFAHTASRLFPRGRTAHPIRQQYFSPRDDEEDTPYFDPALRAVGEYAGLLWRRKIEAIEKGFLPREGAPHESNSMDGPQSFAVAP